MNTRQPFHMTRATLPTAESRASAPGCSVASRAINSRSRRALCVLFVIALFSLFGYSPHILERGTAEARGARPGGARPSFESSRPSHDSSHRETTRPSPEPDLRSPDIHPRVTEQRVATESAAL